MPQRHPPDPPPPAHPAPPLPSPPPPPNQTKPTQSSSTRDDRVHPAHARKMVKRLQTKGHESTTFYYENIEGGHGGAANNKQQAFMCVRACVGACLRVCV